MGGVLLPWALVVGSGGRGSGCSVGGRVFSHARHSHSVIPRLYFETHCFLRLSGRCTSYVQVSGSKLWQTERSCMCCQESGEREATITLHCPKAKPNTKKILTRAPVDCMCRPCTDVEEGTVLAQEIANFIQDSPMDSVPFLK
ncbi:hypothetical protein Pcinc_032750 [Petrolisthes cinctipes]|uniref:Bursicon subunit alpha n=1 Tax=Petrolisthes cinctipes TaxID=88211 RepID=A0AAE1ETE2_PETCI|nr:hypothetical protein Pcinc_032750 [Petrolisthes cinctipes]